MSTEREEPPDNMIPFEGPKRERSREHLERRDLDAPEESDGYALLAGDSIEEESAAAAEAERENYYADPYIEYTEEAILINDTKYRLSENLTISKIDDKLLLIKNIRTKTFIIIDNFLGKTLHKFQRRCRLVDIFPELVEERICPRLSDLYEMMLQARQNFILLEEDSEEHGVPVMEWMGEMRHGFGVVTGYFSVLLGLAAWWFFPPSSFIYGIEHFLVAFLGVCVGRSVATLVGASMAVSAGAEVYDSRFKWASLFPHFDANLTDVQAAGRKAEYNTALARLGPMFLMLGFITLLLPDAATLYMLGLLYHLTPVRGSALRKLLRTRFAPKRMSVHENCLFSQNYTFKNQMYRLRHGVSWGYMFVEFVYNIAWMVSFLSILTLVLESGQVRGIGHLTSFYSVSQIPYILVGIIGVTTLVSFAIVTTRFLFGLQRAKRHRSMHRINPLDEAHAEAISRIEEAIAHDQELTAELLSNVKIFSHVSLLTLSKFIPELETYTYEAGSVICDGEDEMDKFMMLISGKVEQSKYYVSGKRARLPALLPGQILDLVRILYGSQGSLRARARSTCVFIGFDLQFFRNKVVPIIGHLPVNRFLINDTLLRRIPFFASWPDEVLDYIGNNSEISRYKTNEYVIRESSDNTWLYVPVEGRFDVIKRERRVGRLGFGDFFGELSILQNSLSTASVVAREGCYCIAIHKATLLNAMGMDYRIAIFIEEVASSRIGTPVFPLSGNRFSNIAVGRQA